MGVSETKDLIRFIASLGNAIGGSLEDGKLGIGDLGNFLGALRTAIPAFTGAHEIPAELRDMDDSERSELLAILTTEFDIPQDTVEGVLENILTVAISLAPVILQFISKK